MASFNFAAIDNYSFGVGIAVGLTTGILLQKSNILMVPRLLSNIIQGKGRNKLVIVVRTDLGMSKGKVAAQCAHAAVMCYKEALKKAPRELKLWELVGQPKVVVQTSEGETFLSQIVEKAKSKGLVATMIRDAGRTQVERGSATVAGIGPGNALIVDQVTKDFRLL